MRTKTKLQELNDALANTLSGDVNETNETLEEAKEEIPDFINEVRAQAEKKISAPDADLLGEHAVNFAES